ncbi:serine/threonine-protein kinase [Streptomyces fulvoviolaceus]|uniref:serine/threonine-protein kinase n=1 Tax=Streptomyces fulvoviolaceus TaxID=285535 RepID=UPI00069410BB|nr:serine/threonine-protein kinase [Streptomyces fulvoviolaceus]
MERGELIAGRYELVKRLGRGGMGDVWAGRDRTLHRDVAIKLLVLDGAAHEDLPRRFEREAVAAAQINHPNVVALHDRGVHEDLLFLVMEKVAGATLTEHIRSDGPMTPSHALAIAEGICAALIAAHQAGVVHYDIKPHNVMLTPGRQVKVVDFGIAGFLQTAFTLAGSSQLTPAGTPEYGAPEQFLTERGDERSDLYALGGVLFAMLTGRPPFTGHHAMAVMRRKLDEDAPRLDSLRPEMPPALAELVAELLERDPARRPESAQQVLERLSHIRAGLDATTPSTVLDRPAEPPIPDRPTAPADLTRQLPEHLGPFDVSWTGEEPLSTYTSRAGRRGWKAMATLAAVSALVAVVTLSLAAGRRLEKLPGEEEMTPGAVLLMVGVLAAGLAASLAVPVIGRLHGERLRENPTGWALHVGPQYIQTTSGTGRREFTWDQVQRVTIGEIQPRYGNFEELTCSAEYVYTGVHIWDRSAEASIALRPAGWPYPWLGSLAEREDGLFPICVLGPMTEQQRTALTEALARYCGQ